VNVVSKYLADIALYGLALFLVGVGWQFISAIIEVRKSFDLPLFGTSYDSEEKAKYAKAG